MRPSLHSAGNSFPDQPRRAHPLLLIYDAFALFYVRVSSTAVTDRISPDAFVTWRHIMSEFRAMGLL